jgi:hypothetical protein
VRRRVVAGDEHPPRGALDRLAARVEAGEVAADHGRRLAHTGHRTGARQRGVRQQTVRRAGHDQVGLPPRRADEVVEGVADRPEQDQHAEDHPDAEDDAEGGERRARGPVAELADRDAVDRPQHRAVP